MSCHCHNSFFDIRKYLLFKKYPDFLLDKSSKANFRKAAKKFMLFSEELFVVKNNTKLKSD